MSPIFCANILNDVLMSLISGNPCLNDRRYLFVFLKGGAKHRSLCLYPGKMKDVTQFSQDPRYVFVSSPGGGYSRFLFVGMCHGENEN